MVQVTIGGADAPVLYAGPQGAFPGLDQINVQIPPMLAGEGLVLIQVTANGITANPELPSPLNKPRGRPGRPVSTPKIGRGQTGLPSSKSPCHPVSLFAQFTLRAALNLRFFAARRLLIKEQVVRYGASSKLSAYLEQLVRMRLSQKSARAIGSSTSGKLDQGAVVRL